MPTDHDSIDLGHEDEIMEAFVAYDRLVRWEEHNSRLDATEPIVERAYARGRIVALVANLAAQALGVTSDDSETTTPNTEPNPDSIVEALPMTNIAGTLRGIAGDMERGALPPDGDPPNVRRMARRLAAVLPAVESLVAENARLREALTKISDDDLRLDDEYAGSAYDRVVDAAYRALTSIEEGERHDD